MTPLENTKPIDKQATLNFLSSLHVGDGFEYRVSQATDTPTVIASATAVLLRSFLNCLSDLSPDDREHWAGYLLDSLDETGLVNDPADYEKSMKDHPFWTIRAHRTRHTAWAIEALGFGLKNEINFIKPYLSKPGIRKWLDDVWATPWSGGIWSAGNWIMDMGVLLDLQYRHFDDPAAYETLIELLNLLAERLEPETGFWRGPNDDNRVAMAGSMHLYPIYWAYRQELPYFDKAVRATLDLQQSDGLFDFQPGHGGSQCLDYDAGLVLINGYVLFDPLKDQIAAAFKKMRTAIEVNRQESGSWSDCQIDENRFWSTAACVFNARQGSIWDTYARIMTVAMCEKVITPNRADWFTAEHHLFEVFDAGRHWNRGRYQSTV